MIQKEIEKLHTKNKKKVAKIKADLESLYEDLKNETLYMEMALENNELPNHISKAQYKQQLTRNQSIVNRNAIDRVFLKHMGIIDAPTKNLNRKSDKPKPLCLVGKLATKIRSLEKLNTQEKSIITQMLQDLQDDIQ